MGKKKEGGEMPVDWLKIKSEYVNGCISYRNLAEKYGVSSSALMQKAAKEKWSAEKEKQQSKNEAKTKQKTTEKISDALAEEAAARVRIRSKLIHMAEKWIDKQDGEIEFTGDFRRIVQSCIDLGIMGVQEGESVEDDGLIAALGKGADALFNDGDDSDTLPEVGE